MIVVRVSGGGLGVQMFQFASAYALSKHQGNELVIFSDCDSGKNTSFNWAYRLDRFQLFNEVIDEKRFNELHRGRFMRNVEKYYPYYKRRKIPWIDMGFDRNFLKYPRTVILDGIRCGWRFLAGFENDIRQVFQLRESLDSVNQGVLEQIRQCESVSVHIRRGDYLQSPLHFVHGLDYFLKLMKDLSLQFSGLRFFVFSDDIDWCKKNLNCDLDVFYVDTNSTNDPVLDLKLIGACKYNILSNSTFSWWAAYLKERSDGIVFAPSMWFATADLNLDFPLRDFYPQDWQIIDSMRGVRINE